MKPVKVGLLGLGHGGNRRGSDRGRASGGSEQSSGVSDTDREDCGENLEKPRSIAIDRAKLTEDPWEVIRDPEIDVIVEVMGGVDQTKTYILEALERGKHIVTANKDLMALYGSEILAKAMDNQCDVFYEASVAGGIPIIRTLIEGFSSDRIMKIMGIVNGTTNYI
ncbi:hypothetical protein HMSSN036_78810 [Paenibacillus macerans]|nr:hypothetical protein HMSSN036_78810 [Paenibacillus macerans]